ncbi:MAG: 4Fe-4S dicluster domain-containing protein [Chloroflexota bacterium]
MSNRDITRDADHRLYILPPLIVMLVLWGVGLTRWFQSGDALTLVFYGYVGLIVGAGIGGYIAAADRYRPYARRLVILLLGSLLLIAAFVTDHGNMHPEGLFFAVLAGGGTWIVLHYIVAKVVGPVVFGRIWCGWACWYAMIFDLLPYPFSHYRRPGRWGWLRYSHFAVILLVVMVLWYRFGINGATGEGAMIAFALGVLTYYAIGIVMAVLLRDNRAFCKYVCPIAVPMKAASTVSLLKISGVPDHCEGCEACVEMCPMDIRVKDYITGGERVLSTECTLCQTCISVCPHDSLRLSFGLDLGGKEIIDYDASPGNREFHRQQEATISPD